MTKRCTWFKCQNKAFREQKDIGGNIYACLCRKHHVEMRREIESGDHAQIFRAYVKAQGFDDTGAKPGIACSDPTIPPEMEVPRTKDGASA